MTGHPFRRLASSPFGLVVLAVIAIWAVEIVDSTLLGDRLQGGGIHPRQSDGLDGIVWAPFLHSNYAHVLSNSAGLLVLGGLVSARGLRYWSAVTITTALVGGALTWALAGGLNHVGASGVVYGYFGALLGAAWFERRPRALGAALLAIMFYSGLVAGLVPQPAISWEGHLFGMVAGVMASWRLAERSVEPDDEIRYPWELDEPWLD